MNPAARPRVTPPLAKSIPGAQTVSPGGEFSAPVSIYADGDYTVRVLDAAVGSLRLKVDGGTGVPMTASRRPPGLQAQVRLTRGLRLLAIAVEGSPIQIAGVTVEQKPVPPTPEKLALHYRLLGMEPGAEPLQPRKAAEQILRGLLRRAYRRPVDADDIAPPMNSCVFGISTG